MKKVTREKASVVILAVSILLGLALPAAAQQAASSLNARWTAEVEYPAGSMPMVAALAVADNGDTAAVLGKFPSELFYISGMTGKVQWRFHSRADNIRGINFTANGDRLVIKDSRTLKPKTEECLDQMILFDNKGRILWEREAPGAARISPSGEYILAYDPENDFGLDVYSGSNGELLWHVPYEQFGMTRRAVFTEDGRKILAQGGGVVKMFDVAGDHLWSMDFPSGVMWASTSRDGSVTAVLAWGHTAKSELTTELAIVDQAGQELTGMELIRYGAFGPPDSKLGMWFSVQVSSDGNMIILDGAHNGIDWFQALDPLGNLLWDKTIPPEPEVGRLLLPSGVILDYAHTDAGTLGVSDPITNVRRSARVQGKLGQDRVSISPNGAYIAAIADTHVYSFANPLRAIATSKPSGEKLPSSGSKDLKAWVGLRRSLHAERWSLKYNSAKKEVLAKSVDGKREARLQVGSKEALINGKKVMLPDAPRMVQSRVQVPSVALEMLAQAI